MFLGTRILIFLCCRWCAGQLQGWLCLCSENLLVFISTGQWGDGVVYTCTLRDYVLKTGQNIRLKDDVSDLFPGQENWNCMGWISWRAEVHAHEVRAWLNHVSTSARLLMILTNTSFFGAQAIDHLIKAPLCTTTTVWFIIIIVMTAGELNRCKAWAS